MYVENIVEKEEQFLLLSTTFSYLMLNFYVRTRIRFSLQDRQLFEITKVEITRVDCNLEPGKMLSFYEMKSFTSVRPEIELIFLPGLRFSFYT